MQITLNDLEALALGAAVLGSGGGGDTAYDLLLAREELQQYGPVALVPIEEIPSDTWVLPVFFMGAPLVCLERLHSGNEFSLIVKHLEQVIPCKVGGLLPAEIGGSNALPAVYAAAALGLPVVDGDLMGRAFPCCNMCTPELHQLKPGPAIVVDTASNAVGIVRAVSGEEMERLLRGLTTAMGSDAAVCSHPMPQPVAAQVVLVGTLSYALRLGNSILSAQQRKQDPVEAVLEACGGRIVASGNIIDVEHWVESSFQNGRAIVAGGDSQTVIYFQNEFLAVFKEGQPRPLVTTPDLIVAFEHETGLPVAVERLQYGLRVSVVALPAPSVWTTPQGLELVGPAAFGFDWEYLPALTS